MSVYTNSELLRHETDPFSLQSASRVESNKLALQVPLDHAIEAARSQLQSLSQGVDVKGEANLSPTVRRLWSILLGDPTPLAFLARNNRCSPGGRLCLSGV